MIEIIGLTKSYGRQPVLNELAFSVAPGEIVLLVGANGCGKSTTLRLLAGLSAADAGRIVINGRSVDGNRDAALAGLSFLFRLKYLNGSFVGTGSFGTPQSAAIAMPGSFGLLPFIERLAAGQDPNTRTGVVFAIGMQGELSGRRIDLGGLGAFRTWRQLLD